VRGIYEHSPQDQHELDRLNGQTQLLLHDGATLMDVSSTPPLSPSVFATAAASASDSPNCYSSKMSQELQGNPSTSTVPTDGSGQVTMTDLLHPTVLFDMRVLDTDLFPSTITRADDAGYWNGANPEYSANNNANDGQSEPWNDDDAFTAIANAATHPEQLQNLVNPAHDIHPNSYDPLAFGSGSATNDLFGFNIGSEIADFGQPWLDGRADPLGVDCQTEISRANAGLGALGQQQQVSMQPDEESLRYAESESAWYRFMEQLGLPNI
jgi:hypothetical protein